MNAASFAVACMALAAGTLFAAEGAKTVLDFKLDDIDGKPYDLSQNKGKVMLIVNVASKCGNTPQYAGLEAMYEKYKDKGFTIIGVPANEFGKQEPGTNVEIKEFCTSKYKVTFPMLGKVVVKGEGITPLYKYLTTESPKKGDIQWNFVKFLVDRNGNVVDRFEHKMKPEDPKLVAAIEKALAEK
jgi:glutathione peroxidase